MTSPAVRPTTPKLEIELPDTDLAQDEEWCRVRIDGEAEEIRFHDYARIFEIPGLYETLFHDRLECDSPRTVVGLLRREIEGAGDRCEDLAALDVGAGNGMVGEALRGAGLSPIVGIDILPEARAATLRDRPGVYADYLIADLTALGPADAERIRERRPSVLTTVAALGFGDIPAAAFAQAYDLVQTPAWVAFNIKEAFLDPKADQTGFSRLVRRMIDEGLLEVYLEHRYRHRLSISGRPLFYVAIVGRKHAPIPPDWLDGLD